jgi:hypothetical protein
MLSSVLIYGSYDTTYAVHVLDSHVPWLRPSSLRLFLCMLHAARRSEPRTAEFHHEAETSKFSEKKGRCVVLGAFVLSRRHKFSLVVENLI